MIFLFFGSSLAHLEPELVISVITEQHNKVHWKLTKTQNTRESNTIAISVISQQLLQVRLNVTEPRNIWSDEEGAGTPQCIRLTSRKIE